MTVGMVIARHTLRAAPTTTFAPATRMQRRVTPQALCAQDVECVRAGHHRQQLLEWDHPLQQQHQPHLSLRVHQHRLTTTEMTIMGVPLLALQHRPMHRRLHRQQEWAWAPHVLTTVCLMVGMVIARHTLRAAPTTTFVPATRTQRRVTPQALCAQDAGCVGADGCVSVLLRHCGRAR